MVKIKSKIIKVGNSYGVLIPKALIKTGIIDDTKEYEIEIKDKKTLELEKELALLKSKLENINKNVSPPTGI